MKNTTRWLGLALVLALVGVLGFKLFEPIFVYQTGWAPLPTQVPKAVSEARDAGLAARAQVSLAALESAREKIRAPAISAAVSIDGQLVWRGAVGFADIEAGTAATFDTRFRLGSTSKAVTAVAVGKLKLDSYHHAGVAVGSTSILIVLPTSKIVLSLLMNKGGENANDLAALADQILQAYIPAP